MIDKWTQQQYDISLAIAKESNRLKARQKYRDYLISIQYGHKFGDNRRCSCGLLDRDYYMNKEICPLYTVDKTN